MKEFKVILALGMALLMSGCYLPRFTRLGEKKTVSPAGAVVSVPVPAEPAGSKVSSSTKPSGTKFLQQYHSLTWKESVNLSYNTEEELYPRVATITPRTLKRTIDEYYVPMVSEELNVVVDYYEILDTFDDPFLGKYDIDIRAVPEKETVNLMWKRKF